MLYLEHNPAPPLNRYVRTVWYAQSPDTPRHRQKILPSGNVQLVLNLARDFLLDCPEGLADVRRPKAIVAGPRSIYEIIDSSDLANLIGVVFEPAGFAVFARDSVDLFANRSVGLEDVWGATVTTLLDALHEVQTPQERMQCLEGYLLKRISLRILDPGRCCSREVDYALRVFRKSPDMTTVREMARSTGLSERRFSQMFRERVGFAPKTWCRLQRFQQAVKQLHAGANVRWAELALACGYYDQSHFANEFRAFSGIDATTYSATRTRWANHIVLD